MKLALAVQKLSVIAIVLMVATTGPTTLAQSALDPYATGQSPLAPVWTPYRQSAAVLTPAPAPTSRLAQAPGPPGLPADPSATGTTGTPFAQQPSPFRTPLDLSSPPGSLGPRNQGLGNAPDFFGRPRGNIFGSPRGFFGAPGRPPGGGVPGAGSTSNLIGLLGQSDRPIDALTTKPNVIGDLLNGGSRLVRISVPTEIFVRGQIIAGSPGSASAILAFEQDGFGFFNDFNAVPGSGRNTTAGLFADTFDVAEPLPPTDVPTSPGPEFTYDGGTVVYTNSATSTQADPGAFQDDQLWFASYSYSRTVELPPAGGLALSQVKISDNNNALPRDRYFFDYKFFEDAAGGLGDTGRYTFGFEKTFLYGMASVDVRLPFVYSLESVQIDGAGGMRGLEFGNLTSIFKLAVWSTYDLIVSAGMGITIPTAQDSRLFLQDGTQVLVIENNAVQLQPFVASLWIPNELFFVNTFVQLDVDANGNPVRGNINGGILPEIGVLQEPTLLSIDTSGGWWFYQNPCQSACLRGAAAIAELHYTTTVQDADVVSSNSVVVTDSTRRLDVLNVTLGLHAQIGDPMTLTTGLTFPLRDGDDRQFNMEFALLANVFF